VTSAGPLLTPWIDFTQYEYTIYIRDLTVNGRFFTFPNLTVTFANNGRGSYYADAFPGDGGNGGHLRGEPAQRDRALDLHRQPDRVRPVRRARDGRRGQLRPRLQLHHQPGKLRGQHDARRRAGSHLRAGRRSGRAGRWAVLLGVPNATIPLGYDHQVDGECRIPGKTPAAHKTWGAIKSLYR
jgi:hypothetical protein